MTATDTTVATGVEVTPIELRIVVDGASTAGKTTTARSLGERLGRPVVTPEEQDGRTLLFDWVDHEGGRSDGRPIRTQVVAVPGHLPHLRARLLVTADVVLFVADTTERGMPATTLALAQVRTLLDAFEGQRPGLLVQANKRDEPDALPMDEVHRRLEVGTDDLVIETVATTGDGVRQSYVYAVRMGLRHARAVEGERVAERQVTADDLLRELDTDPRPMSEREATAAPDVEDTVQAGGTGETDDRIEIDQEGEIDTDHEGDIEGEIDTESETAMQTETDPVIQAADPANDGAILPKRPPVDHAAIAARDELSAATVAVDAGVGEPAPAAASEPSEPASSHPRAWRRWFDR